MLNYVITIAISAFFVPHYLSIFWEPLNTNPWDIVVGICVIVVLVLVNIVGVKEAARLNVFLAVVERFGQLMSAQPSYGAWIHELHHAAKQDAPSH